MRVWKLVWKVLFHLWQTEGAANICTATLHPSRWRPSVWPMPSAGSVCFTVIFIIIFIFRSVSELHSQREQTHEYLSSLSAYWAPRRRFSTGGDEETWSHSLQRVRVSFFSSSRRRKIHVFLLSSLRLLYRAFSSLSPPSDREWHWEDDPEGGDESQIWFLWQRPLGQCEEFSLWEQGDAHHHGLRHGHV